MNWKKFLMRYNGWMGFIFGTIVFFIAPPIYRLIDPTAGQFDAGYIHPIIYAFTGLCFASASAFFMTKFTAPGPFAQLDRFFENDSWVTTDGIRVAMILYVAYFIGFLTILWAVV